jgi:hypothetical protein
MSDVISTICSMPRDFKVSRKKSMIQLLKESGYLEHEHDVAKEDVMRFLISHPDLIDDWELYSLDQRTSTGWYLLHEDPVWIVGYLNSGKREKESRVTSGFEACAVFIINDLERFAKNAR